MAGRLAGARALDRTYLCIQGIKWTIEAGVGWLNTSDVAVLRAWGVTLAQ